MEAWYQLDLVTAATVWPVTDAEIKTYLKIPSTTTSDNDLITLIKKAATKNVEKFLNRVLISEAYKMTFDTQPGTIDFPLGNLLSVTSIVTVDDDGTTTTDESGKYHTQTGDNGRMYLKVGKTLTTTTRTHGKMIINFVVGYGADETTVPPLIKLGILSTCAVYYATREFHGLPKAVKESIAQYRILAFSP